MNSLLMLVPTWNARWSSLAAIDCTASTAACVLARQCVTGLEQLHALATLLHGPLQGLLDAVRCPRSISGMNRLFVSAGAGLGCVLGAVSC